MLSSISPVDGRYQKTAEPLAAFFSERSLMKFRLMVEGEYLIALADTPGVSVRKLKAAEIKKIRELYNLREADAQIISDIELKGYKNIKATDHDVKAVEYYIKNRLADTTLKDVLEWIHFGLTSEDTNNLSYALMLRDGISLVLIPKLEKIIQEIDKLAKRHKNLSMLARTHGQPASPTTFGKEFKVFVERLKRQISHLKSQTILAKLNGATGNYNAHIATFPKIDWIKFSQKFINSLNNVIPATRLADSEPRRKAGIQKWIPGSSPRMTLQLKLNLLTTQIEPHDSYIEIFDILRRINTVLTDFNQDVWRYISDDWIVQKPQEGAVGSSTMPHKINPIKFENSEGNLGLANALFEFFARKLPISRLQRDLTDSTVQRNFGTALAHCLIAYEYLLKGLSRIEINKPKVLSELESHPEVIAEAIQTVLRREGIKMPYEQLKELTRGKQVTLKDLHKFIDGLEINDKVKKELKKITPKNYIGLASKLAGM